MHAEDQTLGKRLARGNTSDVWEWTPQTVVKVLLPDIPRHWAALEADITRLVHAAGLPVPATDGVGEVDGRPGVVLERIDGETMWHRMMDSPEEVPALIEVLVDIQRDVQSVSPIVGISDLTTRLRRKIDEAAAVSDEDRHRAHELLTAMPSGSALCHGDMHPANIVMSPRGIVIVDWFDAGIGNAMADYTRSSLLLRPPETPGTKRWHLDGAEREVLERMQCSYLSALLKRRLIEPLPFAMWEAVLAVARMSERVPTDDLVSIWSGWQRDGPDVWSRDLRRCMESAAVESDREISDDEAQ